MAENLGEAQLRLTVDLTAFEASLNKARSLIDSELSGAVVRPTTRTGNTRSPAGGGLAGDLGKFIEEAKALNLNTNWGKALRTLDEVDSDLALIGAGENFNIASSWTKALTQLEEIDTDLSYIKSGKNLNLQTSWGRFLSQLEAVKADIDASATQAAATARSRELARGREIGRLNAVDINGRLPGGGFAPGSPGAINARNRRLREASSNALIGGAFPALFGQGLGASVGGALGGGAGGLVGGQFGFGLSLLGTALGGQFDVATQKLQTLGTAINDPINQFSALTDAGVLSSKSLEKQVQALIDTGREAEAAALIQKDLATSYSDLQSAKELAAASDKLGRSWAQLQIAAAELSAEPIADLLSSTASGLNLFADSIKNLKNLLPKSITRLFNPVNALLPGSTALLGGAGGTAGASGAPTNTSGTTSPGEARQTELRQLRLRLITQEAQQEKLSANATERKTIELEKQIALENSRARGERPEQQQQIADEFNKRLLQIDERRLQLEKERTLEVQNRLDIERRAELQFRQTQRQFAVDRKAAANNFADIQGAIGVQRQRSALGLSGTGVGALQELQNIESAKRGAELAAVQRKAAEGRAIDLEREAQILRERQAALEAPNSGATRQEINAAVDAALQARNSAQEAKNQYVLAGDALKAAGAEIVRAAVTAKGNLQDAFKTAKDAVRNITRGIEDSVTALSELQNPTGSGLNKFLGPNTVASRQQAVADRLRPEADALANQLGIRLSFSGTREDVNKQTLEFIKAARQELRMSEDINRATAVDLPQATADLATVNDSLVKVNSVLADATKNLAQKDWAVNVSVNANTGDYAVNLG